MEERKMPTVRHDNALVSFSRNRCAKIVGRAGLPGRRDVVPFALDGQQRGTSDRSKIYFFTLTTKHRLGHRAVVIDALNVLQKERSIEIHDRSVKVEEGKSLGIDPFIMQDLVPNLVPLRDASH